MDLLNFIRENLRLCLRYSNTSEETITQKEHQMLFESLSKYTPQENDVAYLRQLSNHPKLGVELRNKKFYVYWDLTEELRPVFGEQTTYVHNVLCSSDSNPHHWLVLPIGISNLAPQIYPDKIELNYYRLEIGKKNGESEIIERSSISLLPVANK